MKIFKRPIWVLGNHRLWILACAASFILLLAVFSRSNIIKNHGFSTRNKLQYNSGSRSVVSKTTGSPPALAYWIYGSHGESKKIVRLVKAIYHPRNQYLLFMDSDASDDERVWLATTVQSVRVFKAFGNVDVVGKSYGVNELGSSMVAATLHAAALLLRVCLDWDWFFVLSASDYPLLTQDDLLHALAFLPRDINFIHYTNETKWKEKINVNQVVVDPSLYFTKSAQIFNATEPRPMPDAFKIYGGSPMVILSRAFLEYCVQGFENLPRKLLMYFTNVANPHASYFHTVLCNSPNFHNTTINTNLRHIIEDPSAKNMSLIYNMTQSSGLSAAFASPFPEDDDPVLSMIDQNVLHRSYSGVVPGDWCSNKRVNESEEELCTSWGDINGIKPGPNGRELRVFLSRILDEGRLRTSLCRQY